MRYSWPHWIDKFDMLQVGLFFHSFVMLIEGFDSFDSHIREYELAWGTWKQGPILVRSCWQLRVTQNQHRFFLHSCAWNWLTSLGPAAAWTCWHIYKHLCIDRLELIRLDQNYILAVISIYKFQNIIHPDPESMAGIITCQQPYHRPTKMLSAGGSRGGFAWSAVGLLPDTCNLGVAYTSIGGVRTADPECHSKNKRYMFQTTISSIYCACYIGECIHMKVTCRSQER